MRVQIDRLLFNLVAAATTGERLLAAAAPALHRKLERRYLPAPRPALKDRAIQYLAAHPTRALQLGALTLLGALFLSAAARPRETKIAS